MHRSDLPDVRGFNMLSALHMLRRYPIGSRLPACRAGRTMRQLAVFFLLLLLVG